MKPTADIAELQAWAERLMRSRKADFVIGEGYLYRWWVIPRNPFYNVYLHDIRKSDDDRAFHDHPWDNQSLLLRGSYTEHTPDGVFVRHEGEVISRKAECLHRLEVPEGGRVISLFATGPVIREWGFACPQGWRHWKDFVDNRDGTSLIGQGCD